MCPTPLCFCSCCGLPINDSETGLCSQCLKQPPLFDHCLAPFLYQFPVNRILQMVKYQSRLELINPIVKPLAELLMEFYEDDDWPEVMLPVPLHRKRLRERGYDQALLLAKALKKQLHFMELNIEDRLIKKQTNSVPQQSLDAKDRQKNIRNAFALRKQPQWDHVALIDDVVTTGATVSEITKLLKQNGVKRVDIWSIARTPENE
nr:ComF family protein [Endozoicomonas sp.]